MNDNTSPLYKALKSKGHSLTKVRLAVFESMQGKETQTIRELTSQCSNMADRASVYRTIKLFERLGIVQRLQVGWKYKLELSAAFSYHHHHLHCLACGMVRAIEEDLILENAIDRIAHVQNFYPTNHLLEIRGFCTDCQGSQQLPPT